MKRQLTDLYRITEQNLELRKQFIRLQAKDIHTLAKLVRWSKHCAPQIAKEFYDHQFGFAPTRAFFEEQAARKGMLLDTLRNHLEAAQAGYIQQIVDQAATSGKFGCEYFEQRLKVGRIHNMIDLPPKWYIGSYTLYQDLMRKHLNRSFFYRPLFAASAARAFGVVFNYDIQAICDAFTLDMMESAGMDLINVDVQPGRDLTEYIGEIKNAFSQEIEGIGNSLSEGDLTIIIEPRSDNDVIRTALAQIVTQLQSTLFKVSATVEELRVASAELSDSSLQAGMATSQIATTIQEMVIGITRQAESTERTAHSMHELEQHMASVSSGANAQTEACQSASSIAQQINMTILQVAENAKAGAEQALVSSGKARGGAKTVDENMKVMCGIQEKVGLSAQKVAEMGRHSEMIGAIVNTIEDISSQTNLLALNAAIEAARAGEHGRGFSVVADEVRKLAEKSSVATGEIADLIRGIQLTISEAVQAMNEGSAEVEAGMTGAKVAGAVFEEILRAAEVVHKQVESISLAATEMTGHTGSLTSSMQTLQHAAAANRASSTGMETEVVSVNASVENIASISQETSAGAEEMSATAQEMSAQVGEVGAAARALENLADNLSQQVSQFRLPAGQAKGHGPLRLAA